MEPERRIFGLSREMGEGRAKRLDSVNWST